MRILVCGGRDYQDYDSVDTILGSMHDVDLIINGGAKGADELSSKWASKNQKACLVFPALWHKEGKAAGPLRNIRMVKDGQPDLVVAFPGGKGTAHMVKYAEEQGVPVWKVEEKEPV